MHKTYSQTAIIPSGNKPILIIIGGFAGAGKSTMAARLGRDYGYAVFSSDTINDVLRDALRQSFKETSPMAHRVMWHLVRRQLQLGLTVIMDTHMAAAHIWQSLDELKRDLPDVQAVPIILQATLDTHRSRIEERGRTDTTHLNLGGDKFEDVLYKYAFIEELQRPDIIKVDANGEPDAVYALVQKVLHEQIS